MSDDVKKNGRSLSRRMFLGSAAAAGAFTVVPSSVLAGSASKSPNEKLNIAGVGVGGRGYYDVLACESENIVALCDVDSNYASKAFKKWPKANKYTDFRKMFDKEGDNIDAVVIATPDHTHALVTMEALKRKKHVYCEKPLTHNVWEARKIAEAARKAGVTTQLGIQGHSREGTRLVKEWIAAGVIGDVHGVEAWSDESYYPPGYAAWAPSIRSAPKKGQSVPKSLDWDLWLGPRKKRAFHEAYHPLSWRAWWDFGTGWTCDRGVHTMDPIAWALNLGRPEVIDARSSLGHNPDTHPLVSIITYEFPKQDVKVTWYEGVRPPRPKELGQGQILGDRHGGMLFKGTKGMITAGIYADDPRLLPQSTMKEFVKDMPAKTLPRVKTSHQMNWVEACKAGEEAVADFQYGSLVTEICLLGNVAKWVNDRVHWNPDKMKVTNLAEAQKQIREEYHNGWSLA